jgi:ABC-type Mn2+/Zn2+ transport system permease subunit
VAEQRTRFARGSCACAPARPPSIRVAGTLYAFGCLVLPALVAKNLCREVRQVLVLALAAAVCGFVAAHAADTPPAHTTVALLCALLPLSWPVRRWRSR